MISRRVLERKFSLTDRRNVRDLSHVRIQPPRAQPSPAPELLDLHHESPGIRGIANRNGLHEDIEQAIKSADREGLLAVLTHQVTILQERIAKVLHQRGEALFPLV